VAGRVAEPLPSAIGVPVDDVSPPPTEPSAAPTPSPTATPSDGESTEPPEPTEPSVPTTSTPVPSTAPTAQEPPAATVEEVRAYTLVGGRATLRFEPGAVSVVVAEPAQGFTVDVEGSGTAEVTVEFENDDHRSRLRGSWEDGPRDRVEEDDDHDRGEEEAEGED
jgi:hypothetical protein